MNILIGLLIIAISIVLMYAIGRITIHVIEPSNKHPDLMMIMLGFGIFTVGCGAIVCIFMIAAEIGNWMMH
jgi:Na+/pantothenate symporter